MEWTIIAARWFFWLLHSMILARLGPSPLAEDQLLRDLAVSPAELAPAFPFFFPDETVG